MKKIKIMMIFCLFFSTFFISAQKSNAYELNNEELKYTQISTNTQPIELFIEESIDSNQPLELVPAPSDEVDILSGSAGLYKQYFWGPNNKYKIDIIKLHSGWAGPWADT